MIVRIIARLTGSPVKAFIALTVNIVLAGWVYSLIEHVGPISGPWWGIVTGSTTGYGDLYPKDTAGRGVAVYLIMSSIVLVAIFTAQVVNHVLPDPDRWSDAEQCRLFEQLDAIEASVTGRLQPGGECGWDVHYFDLSELTETDIDMTHDCQCGETSFRVAERHIGYAAGLQKGGSGERQVAHHSVGG